MKSIYLPLFIFAPLYSSIIHAGQLDSFENSVASASENNTSNSTESTGCRNAADCRAKEEFSNFLVDLAVFGGMYSFERVNPTPVKAEEIDPDDDFEVVLRSKGEPVIPFVRVDYSYQRSSSSLSATDVRLDTGYGPIAISFANTTYEESAPADTLNIRRIYGAYRMSFGPYVEVDLGVGSLNISGNKEQSYGYVTLPILIYPNSKYGVEIRSGWAGNIEDYDVGFFFSNYKLVSTKLGYRKVSAGDESIKGPNIGISVHY